jgi:hypothetical protein
VRDRLDGKRVSQTPTRNTEAHSEPLGAVHGQQLDRSRPRSGWRRRAVALVVLGGQVGQQRGSDTSPSTAWNSATAFTNRSRLSRRAAAAGLTADASSTSVPVVSMMPSDDVEQRLADVRAQHPQLAASSANRSSASAE